MHLWVEMPPAWLAGRMTRSGGSLIREENVLQKLFCFINYLR